MKVIYGINKIQKFRKPVVALGVFDGVHRGHVHILRSVARMAKRTNGTAMALTFDPHPQRENNIYSLEHRLRLIDKLGIEVCIVINFNQTFSRVLAEDFVSKILVKKIGAAYICVGDNFRFGRGAKGDFALLNRLSRLYNYKLKIFKVIKINGQPVSSTYIRKLIIKGNLKDAQRLLTRPVSILGTVIEGSSLARKLGFPTANIDPHHEVIPPSGVYAVKIIFNNRQLNGICYIGTKPTFNTQYAIHDTQYTKNIEVYIFNFNQNIYGKYLEIQFVKRIRNEKKFASIQALAEQVKKDVFLVKRLFSHH